MIEPPKPLEDYNNLSLSEDLRDALDAVLQEINSSSWFDGGLPVDAENYTLAIQYLYLTFPNALDEKAGRSQLIGWPVFLLPDYLTALRDRDPMALVILAYYGAALHRATYIWWLRGLGARLVRAVSELVGHERQRLLAWPLSCIEQTVSE